MPGRRRAKKRRGVVTRHPGKTEEADGKPRRCAASVQGHTSRVRRYGQAALGTRLRRRNKPRREPFQCGSTREDRGATAGRGNRTRHKSREPGSTGLHEGAQPTRMNDCEPTDGRRGTDTWEGVNDRTTAQPSEHPRQHPRRIQQGPPELPLRELHGRQQPQGLARGNHTRYRDNERGDGVQLALQDDERTTQRAGGHHSGDLGQPRDKRVGAHGTRCPAAGSRKLPRSLPSWHARPGGRHRRHRPERPYALDSTARLNRRSRCHPRRFRRPRRARHDRSTSDRPVGRPRHPSRVQAGRSRPNRPPRPRALRLQGRRLPTRDPRLYPPRRRRRSRPARPRPDLARRVRARLPKTATAPDANTDPGAAELRAGPRRNGATRIQVGPDHRSRADSPERPGLDSRRLLPRVPPPHAGRRQIRHVRQRNSSERGHARKSPRREARRPVQERMPARAHPRRGRRR